MMSENNGNVQTQKTGVRKLIKVIAIIFTVMFLFILITLPCFINLRQKTYDASAKSAGRNAKLAQEVFYESEDTKLKYRKILDALLNEDKGLVDDNIDRETEPKITLNARYATGLEQLLAIDTHLTDDPGVTFNFLHASNSGFTLTTTHAQGSRDVFTYTNK